MRRDTPLRTCRLFSSPSPDTTDDASDFELLVLPMVDKVGRVGGLLIVVPPSGLVDVEGREEDSVGPVADLTAPFVRAATVPVLGTVLSLSRPERDCSGPTAEFGLRCLSMSQASHPSFNRSRGQHPVCMDTSSSM